MAGPEGSPNPTEASIVIIGGGLAGMAAALEAVASNASLQIVMLEKEPKVGGNSAKASSGINAAQSPEDYNAYLEDIIKSGGGYTNPVLAETLVKQSLDGIRFLESKGVDLSVHCQLGGHSVDRTRRNKTGPNVGFAIISALKKAIEESPQIKIVTQAKVTKLLSNGNAVSGLEYQVDGQNFVLSTPAVILATGGYAANTPLLKSLAPGMEAFATTNGPWATGDGLGLAQELGAPLVDTDKVQLHPTGFIDPKDRHKTTRFLAPEGLRGAGGILFNIEGHRFVNELATRKVVSDSMLAQPEKRSFLVLIQTPEVQATVQSLGLGFYEKIGLVQVVSNLDELSDRMQVSKSILAEEFDSYLKAARGETTDAFGRKAFAHVKELLPMYVMEVEPVVHYCMGGVKINERAQVVMENDVAFHGLFAAGEVSGGLHGANRLGGNSLAECVVFGRLAGQHAAQVSLGRSDL
ncbi:unnamed protein product [Aphanomyces euteiches]|uniref:fumarate reductase (NADH) n=1 Tax=Aphanomyces euteiches TaxID=100861 RepID=A0A6G0X0I2_9STRA|nr:hypothetical protein Ae201684_009594 [Aphanomyces euteiches]KAH9085771.1 hypothetical protein Ae201684P_005472 [Aphanomyces euteiches]KAH9152853.1 hypothetical protein AeRB84_004780 [Aphanomyces euteiches]